jgi:hypothetical protein
MKAHLSFFLSASLVWGPYAQAQSRVANLSSSAVLANQSERISKNLKTAFSLYTKAKNEYDKKGPQAFVNVFAKPSALNAEDQKSFVSLFRGLPQLPEMQLAARGFALSDRRAGYSVQVEVLDLDESIFKINGEVFHLGVNESFERSVVKIEEIFKRSKSANNTLFDKALGYLIPEAQAIVFLIPLLAGGIAAAIAKYIQEANKAAPDTSGLATEPGSGAGGTGHDAGTPLAAPVNTGGAGANGAAPGDEDPKADEEPKPDVAPEGDHPAEEGEEKKETEPKEMGPFIEQLCTGNKLNDRAKELAAELWNVKYGNEEQQASGRQYFEDQKIEVHTDPVHIHPIPKEPGDLIGMFVSDNGAARVRYDGKIHCSDTPHVDGSASVDAPPHSQPAENDDELASFEGQIEKRNQLRREVEVQQELAINLANDLKGKPNDPFVNFDAEASLARLRSLSDFMNKVEEAEAENKRHGLSGNLLDRASRANFNKIKQNYKAAVSSYLRHVNGGEGLALYERFEIVSRLNVETTGLRSRGLRVSEERTTNSTGDRVLAKSVRLYQALIAQLELERSNATDEVVKKNATDKINLYKEMARERWLPHTAINPGAKPKADGE